MSVNGPTKDTFDFVIDGAKGEKYDAYLYITEYQDFNDLSCRYRRAEDVNEPWIYLSPSIHPDGPSAFQTEIDAKMLKTAEDTDKEVDRLIDGFNAVIQEQFGKDDDSEKPESGLDLVKWTLKHALVESANVITRVA